MRQIGLGLLAICVLHTAVPGVRGQGGGAGSQGTVPQRMAGLEAEILRLRMELSNLRADVGLHGAKIDTLTESAATNGTAITGLLGDVASNTDRIRALTNLANDNSLKLKDVASQDGGGGYYPNLVGNMEKPEFRREMREAVRGSAATQGRLWIQNNGPERLIYVNGVPWRALTGRSYVWVPVGNVSVTHYSNVVPSTRNDWNFNSADGIYETAAAYDFVNLW